MSLSKETRRARRTRVARLDPADPVDLYELRDALVTDSDARVRCAAILRLDGDGAARLRPYLHDAVRDPSMLVREAAFVALARARDQTALSLAANACRHDRGFRVRRMAMLYAARTCGLDSLHVLAVGSRDPFWRVRVAARRVGAALDVTIDARGSEGHISFPSTVPEVDDPDPAVVAARLARWRGPFDARSLVGVLSHSHRALRSLAVKHLAAHADVSTLRSVLRWLEDERVPYGPAAAEVTLARSGDRAVVLAAQVLRDASGSPAALAWALRTVVEPPLWSTLQAALLDDAPVVRRAATLLTPESAPDRASLFEAMTRILEDPDDQNRVLAATWLARMRGRDARTALEAIDPQGQPTPVRALLAEHDATLGRVDALRRFTDDAHGGVRAAALSALSRLGALTAIERHELRRDPDPWIRRAVLAPGEALPATRDPSVLVRRAAVRMLDATQRSEWAAWATTAPAESDPYLRVQAATILSEVSAPAATRALLRLARDSDFGVRSAAIRALDGHRDPARHLLDSGDLTEDERLAAYTLLHVGGLGANWHETGARGLAHLQLLDDVMAGRSPAPLEHPTTPPPVPAPRDHLRELGRSGLFVHSFGLSGAHGLDFDDFEAARERGANLFFWEPSHHELARFLRSRRGSGLVVVAGTYHADPSSIERDVVRSLRTLKRDVLDVFLAFWTRSSSRIDEVSSALEDLAKRGLIRASGISTHDRELACEAADRGFGVVMVRHNAAHRGAESSVFPHCAARSTGVLTFSNLCYGRMLHRTPAVLSRKVTAPDCYRYSLSQPGVHACVAAPRRHSELAENLAVIDDPTMDAARQAELRAHGDFVYARSKAWSAETWGASKRLLPEETPDSESLSDWIDQPESISPPVW